MAIEVAGIVGPQIQADGTTSRPRLGKGADVIVSELHGRFYEQAYRGALYSGGSGLVAINNVTFTTATLGATCTPIIGIWNPPTSGVNAVVLQAAMGVTITAATATGGGPYAWAVSIANSASLTTGNPGWKRNTLAQTGGQVKWLGSGNAATGLTTTLVVMGGSSLGGGALQGYNFVGTAAGAQAPLFASVENFDGSLVVPPGGVLVLLATTTPVAHSAAPNILWEEVAI